MYIYIYVSIWPHVALFWSPGWHAYAVAVWIVGPLSLAATREKCGLSQTQGIFVQLQQDNLNLAILEIGRPQVEEGSAIVWLAAARTSRSRRDEDCHVHEWTEVRSGVVWLYTFGDEVRILHLPWRSWTFSWLGIQNTSEDSLVWISFCEPSRGCGGWGWGDRGHAYVSRLVRTKHFETSLDPELR